MGEVIIFDKSQADTLLTLGFSYTTRKLNDKEAYVFVDTPNLEQELNRHFDKKSFTKNKYVCFQEGGQFGR